MENDKKGKEKTNLENGQQPAELSEEPVENQQSQQEIPAIEEHPDYMALKEENSKLYNEINEQKDKYLRKIAEFENYKKRTENEKLDLLKYGAEFFIKNLLPVYDDLERSLSHINEKSSAESIRDGLNMVVNKFTKLLDDQGIKKIDAKGKPFDVNYHEALLQQAAEGVEPHTVLEVIQPGYLYKDKVIRHAQVIVSQAAGEADAG